MNCDLVQLDLFDDRGTSSHARAPGTAGPARAWLVTASAAEARLIDRLLRVPRLFATSHFLDVSNGHEVIGKEDIILLKTPGVADAVLFVPDSLSEYDVGDVAAAVLAASPWTSGPSLVSPADLMLVTFRGAPDRAFDAGPHRSRLELLLRHLRTAAVRTDVMIIMRLCEDALALVEPAGAVVLSAALDRMRVSSLAIQRSDRCHEQVTREAIRAATRLRASGRVGAARSLERLVFRSSVDQAEMFPVDGVAVAPRHWPSLGAVIRKCTALPLAVDLPDVDTTSTPASGRLAQRQAIPLELPACRIATWLRDHGGNLLIPSVTISEAGGRSRSMAVALTSELSFLVGGVPGGNGGGTGAEWTVIPHSPQRKFEPVASNVRAGCATTFTFDSGGRRISKLYLTVSRLNRPARTLRVPLSHQRYE